MTEQVVPAGRRSATGATAAAPVLTLEPDPEDRRIATGFDGVDRVLGGGFVRGSVVLVAGAPGIGKSTLLLQLASRLTAAGHPCLIASGEEARAQVAARARRLGLDGSTIRFVPGRDVHEVRDAALIERPDVLVVDSVHTIRDPDSDSLPGGVAQVRTSADMLTAMAKEHGITVVLVGHVTKEGELAGPRTLEHIVDAVLTFDGDPRSGQRLLSGGKNRFGAEGEVAWFEMTPKGLVEAPPSARRTDGDGEPGAATFVAVAGRRALVVDVQALVVPTEGPPRRQAVGLDPKRFNIVAAVVDRCADLRLTRSEIYGTSTGGFRVDDPAADLAVAVALASAARGSPAPPATAFVGEIGLTGSVRPAPGMERRMAAAAAAGIHTVVGSFGHAPATERPASVTTVEVRHVREALAWATRHRDRATA